jgi:hypothetical protein
VLDLDETPLGALQMLVISREASEMFGPSQKTEQHSHAIEEE